MSDKEIISLFVWLVNQKNIKKLNKVVDKPKVKRYYWYNNQRQKEKMVVTQAAANPQKYALRQERQRSRQL
jgi:hypothetical protein